MIGIMAGEERVIYMADDPNDRRRVRILRQSKQPHRVWVTSADKFPLVDEDQRPVEEREYIVFYLRRK